MILRQACDLSSLRSGVLWITLSFIAVSVQAGRQATLQFPSGDKIRVDIVDTPQDRERGLMFREKLPRDYGMLFVFPKPMGLQFWMKNTWVSLDIIYIGSDKKITRIHRRVRPSKKDIKDSEVARVSGTGQYVLELPAGAAERRKLKEGQALRFGVSMPSR